MAANQTHLDIRYDLTNRIATMLQERDTLSASATRYAAIGVPSAVGDGGATCTGQLLDAVQAVQELLDTSAGDPDFGGIAPVITAITPVGTEAAPTNIGPSKSALRITVRNLLPFPKVVIRPAAAGDDSTDVDLTAFIASTTFSRVTDTTTGIAYPVGVITLSDVTAAAFTSGNYTLRVQNPLDTTAEVATRANTYLAATA
ncbi:MAG: hypothetical protein KA745_06750 [Gemmatimonadales bacterium]|nr:hypothetical protein [Gemmatimonadales bacterium]